MALFFLAGPSVGIEIREVCQPHPQRFSLPLLFQMSKHMNAKHGCPGPQRFDRDLCELVRCETIITRLRNLKKRSLHSQEELPIGTRTVRTKTGLRTLGGAWLEAKSPGISWWMEFTTRTNLSHESNARSSRPPRHSDDVDSRAADSWWEELAEKKPFE